MNKYESIACVLGGLLFVLALTYPVYASNQCRVEALKTNKSAEEISKICK